jgi:hypothetical protein
LSKIKLLFWVFSVLLAVLLCPIALAEVRFASDITSLGVGARPLGMGKMFVGLADDISSMYLNPGGLGNLKAGEFLSMSGRFVNQVNYLTLAVSTPTDRGTFAVGYTGAGLGFNIPVLNLIEIATGEYRVIPSTNESVDYNYLNQAAAFSYGLRLPWFNLSAGTTLKIFSESIKGSSNNSSLGMDLDIGALYKPNTQFSLGATLKNALPASLGGKVRWDTGLEETVPSSFVLGGNYQVTTPKIGLINLGADYEIQPTRANIPSMFHLGLEYWPLQMFAFRTGIDQDVIGSGTGTGLTVSNNPTAGLSLLFSDWRFDYAFHKYNNLTTNDTHYFSLVYLPPEKIPLQVLSPSDKEITHESTVIVRGKVADRKINKLTINGKAVQINNNIFETEVSLLLGKNTIWVGAFDAKGKVLETKRIRLLRLEKFSDVPDNYWARNEIEALGTLNIVPGFKDGTFKPDKKSKRFDYLIKLMNIGKVPPATEVKTDPFTDVKAKDKIAPYVQAGQDVKLVKGYPDKKFRPYKIVNRVEGTVMTVRFANLKLESVNERPYEDIAARHWAIKEISAAKQQDMLKFALEYLYPKNDLTRSELTAMLAHTPEVKILVDDLMNFESGYSTEFPTGGVI